MENKTTLTSNFNLIKQQLTLKKHQSNLTHKLKSLLVEMAVGVAKSEISSEGVVGDLLDIEALYIRCNQLLSLIHLAHSKNEINKSTFLSFEIQIQSLLHRLLRISQKITSQSDQNL